MAAKERRFRLHFLRPLGSGGMAEVYLARLTGDFGLERFVAVKQVLPQFAHSREFAEMLFAEARASARLAHPNLVQTFEVGVEKGRAFVVMEYVPGPDLKRLLKELARRNVTLPLEHALRIAADAAAGLHAAHTYVDPLGTPHPLVHCDVSPHNILVSLDGAIKLTDFGIARAQGEARLRARSVKGKVSYLSPEAACGMPVDARSDVFSLGVVLFEMLTGTLPFKREQHVASLGAIVREPVPNPSLVSTRVPPDVADAALGALRKHPEERTPSAAALRDELEAAMVRHGLSASAASVACYVQTLLGEDGDAFPWGRPRVDAPGVGEEPGGAPQREPASVVASHRVRPEVRAVGEGDDTLDLLPLRMDLVGGG